MLNYQASWPRELEHGTASREKYNDFLVCAEAQVKIDTNLRGSPILCAAAHRRVSPVCRTYLEFRSILRQKALKSYEVVHMLCSSIRVANRTHHPMPGRAVVSLWWMKYHV